MKHHQRAIAAALACLLLAGAAGAEEAIPSEAISVVEEAAEELIEVDAPPQQTEENIEAVSPEAERGDEEVAAAQEEGLEASNEEQEMPSGLEQETPSEEEQEAAQQPSEDEEAPAALTAPKIEAEGAAESGDGLWLFTADADTEELSFTWECAGAQAFDVSVTDEEGEELLREEGMTEPALALPLEDLEAGEAYTLRVTAWRDEESAQGTLTFTFAQDAEEQATDAGEAAEGSGETSEGEESDTESDGDTSEDSTDADTSDSSSASSTKSSKKSSKKSSSHKSSSSKSSSSSGKTKSGTKSTSTEEDSPEREDTAREEDAQYEALAGRVAGITLDEGGEYTQEMDGTTLRLAPLEEGEAWHIAEGALDALYESGVEAVEFPLSSRVFTVTLQAPALPGEEAEEGEDTSPDASSPALTIEDSGVTVETGALLFSVEQSKSGRKDKSEP